MTAHAMAVLVGVGVLATGAFAAAPAPPARDYAFDGTISRPVLENYLSRSVLHVGLLASSPERPTAAFEEDLAMLVRCGAKFIGRVAYTWNVARKEEIHFELAAERAALVHRADPDIILQACVFETAYKDVETIPVPAWVFEEFGQPSESRTFRYEAMLYEDGVFRDRWGPDASVPDMSRLETRMWFYYRARRYIDAGCEAIHFGQVQLMNRRDPGYRHWADLLGRVRRYAAAKARRHLVLCDAHVVAESPDGGVTSGGRLLFDLLSYPLRPQEGPEPLQAKLVKGYMHAIYGRSPGGTTPSGWTCDHLPYLAEFDNFGFSGKPGTKVGGIWIWGYDEVSWFSRLGADEKAAFLRYAWAWLRQNDPNGHLQFCTRKPVWTERGAMVWKDLTQEAAIKALWEADR